MARSGLRLGEAFALRWDDIDVQRREIHVEHTVSDGEISSTKSKRSRPVDMSSALRDLLLQFHKDRLEEKLARGWEEMPPWVFVTHAGTRMEQSRVGKAFKRVSKAAGLALHFSAHSLRHTFASLLLQQGESPAYVQRQLGHASIQLTVDTCGRWLPMGNKAAVDRLDDDRSGSRMVATATPSKKVGPLSSSKQWSRRADLNRRPADYESLTVSSTEWL